VSVSSVYVLKVGQHPRNGAGVGLFGFAQKVLVDSHGPLAAIFEFLSAAAWAGLTARE